MLKALCSTFDVSINASRFGVRLRIQLLMLFAALMYGNATSAQELIGWWPETGGPITIAPTNGTVDAFGLDFISPNAELIPIEFGERIPFTFLLANSPNQINMMNDGNRVAIDGELTLNVRATADAEISASWQDGPQFIPFPVTTRAVVPEPSTLSCLVSLVWFAFPLAHSLRRLSSRRVTRQYRQK